VNNSRQNDASAQRPLRWPAVLPGRGFFFNSPPVWEGCPKGGVVKVIRLVTSFSDTVANCTDTVRLYISAASISTATVISFIGAVRFCTDAVRHCTVAVRLYIGAVASCTATVRKCTNKVSHYTAIVSVYKYRLACFALRGWALHKKEWQASYLVPLLSALR
jgi:hypothetical protein